MLSPREISQDALRGSIKAALQACAVNATDRGLWIERTADACGVEVRTFQGHFYGETPPRLEHFMRYVAHLGPAFASRVLAPAGVACVRACDLTAVNSAEAIKITRQAATVMKGLSEDLERLGRDGEGT